MHEGDSGYVLELTDQVPFQSRHWKWLKMYPKAKAMTLFPEFPFRHRDQKLSCFQTKWPHILFVESRF